MSEQAQDATPEVEGIAGYVTPFPYVESLQEKMDELIDEKVPRSGSFCGFCYGRLTSDGVCSFCGTSTTEQEPVDRVPREVLLIYKAKKSTEARWVHSGAMVGLLTAAGLFVALVVWGPGILGHPGVAFAVLIGGGYLLAQLFGALIAAQIGYRSGARKRDAAWEQYLVKRDGQVTEPPLGRSR